MADPRFYDNRGPFSLARICQAAAAPLPDGAHGDASIDDVASLSGAGPSHLTFFTGGSEAATQFATTSAGFCFVGAGEKRAAPQGCVAVPCASVQHAFAAAARMFYPDFGLGRWSQDLAVHPTARFGEGVTLAHGVVIGPGVEIGKGTHIGPNTVIARGTAIGRDCEIGCNVSISHALIGDAVWILPGAQIGQSGFGFASSARGHENIPQLGRVIVQDKVEIGASTAVDRAALGDTVIGEGTKIDNLVQIGHNTRIGRHCAIAAHAGISGSCELGDFVIMGGQVGVADHVTIGAGSRFAARAGVISNLAGGMDYGGIPAKPLKQWARELVAIANLAKGKKKT